jgi:hypothetical protein
MRVRERHREMSDRNGNRLAFAAAIATAVVIASASTASADIIFSYGFTDLDGDYNAGSSTFTAQSVDAGPLRSGGDVTRQASPIGSAEFDTGFMSLGTLANYTMSMTLSNITPTSADVLLGDASFEITDADGDTIVGDIVGVWDAGPDGWLYFDGTLVNVFLNDNGAPDGTFDGPSGGAFDLDFGGEYGPFDGAIVTLSVNASGDFFLNSFNDASTLVSAEVVPAPASLALLGLGGLFASRRRRRA